MNRGEILTVLAQRLNKGAGTVASLDTATKARLVDHLDEVHRDLMSRPGLQRLRDDTLTFASVANQARYALPWVAKVHRLIETTNDRLLIPMTLAQYRAIDPDPASNAGTPDAWIWTGYQPVAVQPSDASSLFAKSTSASDTQTIYLEGETTGGYPRAVSIALTGTTAVNLASTISTWTRITKVYLASAAVGTVTILEDSGSGTELARIGIGQASQRYIGLILFPTPSAVITYTADATLGITDLAQDSDVPLLPDDFHDLLVAGAMVREYEKTDDDRLNVSAQRYARRRAELLQWLASVGDSPWQGRPSVYGRSRLGPWFQAGT